MTTEHSAFDRVKAHLDRHGSETPVPQEMQDDLRTLVRRCHELRSLGDGYGDVELSPYLESLLRVSGVPR